MKRKLLSVILILALIMTSAVCAFASNGTAKGNSGKPSKESVKATTSSNQGDSESMNSKEKLKKEKQAVHSDSKASKENLIEKRKQIQAGYTVQERNKINAAGEAIKNEDPEAKVLGFESVISNKAHFKFDTPPVIKGGRTLIPVRAITQGFGAELTYDQETKLVTVAKGETVIKLTLGSTIAVVNGQEVQMDTKANIMNSRTYVPLRFILETLNLSVSWDDETETVIIDDDTAAVPEDGQADEGTADDEQSNDVTDDGQTDSTTTGAVTVTE